MSGNDITLGMQFKVDGKEAVNTMTIGRGELKNFREEHAKLTAEQKQAAAQEEALTKKTKEYVDALVKKVATLGANRQSMLEYEAAQLKLTEAEQKAVVSMQQQVDAFEKHEAGMTKLIATAGRVAAAAGVAGIALAAMVRKEAIDHAIEAAEAQVRLESTLKATGLSAGLTSRQLNQMADDLAQSTRFDDEGIREGIAMMLRFKDVQGDTFKEAIQLAADYAESSKTDFASAAQAIGRALQDPDNAMRLLIQTGGRFSEANRDQIKAMKAAGQETEAQAQILDRLKGSIGGTAAAMNTGLMKAQADQKKAWSELLEAIGQTDTIAGRWMHSQEMMTNLFDGVKGAIKGTDSTLQAFAGDIVAYMPVFSALGTQLKLAADSQERLRAQGGLGNTRTGKITNAGINDQQEALDGAEQQRLQREIERQQALRKAEEEAAAAAAKAYEAVRKAANDYLDTLAREALAVGATTEQKIMLTAAMHAMTLATNEERSAYLAKATAQAHATQVAEDDLKFKKELEAATKKATEAQIREVEELEKAVETQKRQNDELLYGKGAYEDYQAAMLEATLTSYQANGATEEETATLRRKIAALRELQSLRATGEAIKETQAAEKEFYRQMQHDAEQWGAIFEDIIMQAMFDGGVKGSEIMKRIFQQMVLKPTIDAFTGANGGGGGIVNGLSAVGNLFSAGSFMGKLLAGGNLFAGSGTLNALAGMANSAGMPNAANFLNGMSGNPAAVATDPAVLAGNAAANAISKSVPWIAAALSVYMNNKAWGNDTVGKVGVFGGAGVGFMIGGPIGAAIGAAVGGRLFGRGPTNNDASGLMGDMGYGTASGQVWQDKSQRGGLFRSDKRWTEYNPWDEGTAAVFGAVSKQMKDTLQGIGRDLGLDADALLQGFSHSFKIETKDKTQAEIQAMLNEVFVSAFKEESAQLFGEGTNLGAAVAGFKGTLDEFETLLGSISTLAHAGKDLDLVIEGLGQTTIPNLKASLLQLDDSVTAGWSALNDAIAANDPNTIATAEQGLQAAIVNRYNTEKQWIEQLADALQNLKQQGYEFQLGIANRLNSVGGKIDIGAMAGARAADIRGDLDHITDPARRVAYLNQYLSVIDTEYNARKQQLLNSAAQQQQQAQAAAAANAAIAQARIAAMQTELALANQWNAVLGQTRQMIEQMKYSTLNPAATSARYGLSVGDSNDLFSQFQSATGAAKIALAQRLLPSLQQRQQLLSQTAQRPSDAYQGGYNEIAAMLAEVEQYSQTEADRAIALQQQMIALQSEANAASADYYDTSSAQMEELNAVYREQLTFAAEEGQKAYDQQEAQHRELLNQITGGMEIDLYMAKLQTESKNALLDIKTLLAQYLTGSADGNAPRVVTTGGNGGGGNTKIVGTPNEIISEQPVAINIGGQNIANVVLRTINENGYTVRKIVEAN